jgi:predicted DNA-binding antitoxin AbrB/MazE fold protein
MNSVINATFDGSVFRPTEPVRLQPNTSVELTVKPLPAAPAKAGSFLQVARSLKIQGPPDWSENVDNYLYGEEPSSDR